MRSRARLRELLAEYDSTQSFNSAMDAADLLEAFVAVSREVVAEFEELYDNNTDQAWQAYEDDEGRVILECNDGEFEAHVVSDDPWRDRGPIYKALRAIYGGEP